MKAYIKYILLIIISHLFITSCEDVVDVDVPTGKTRLVVEASLDWEKGTTGNNQIIKLKTSTPYFDNTTNTAVVGAIVKVTNTDTSQVYSFVDQNDGNYTISNFVPILNNTYVLEINYNSEVYTATETLYSVANIINVDQSIDGGFDDEIVEINVEYQDPVNIDNFYLHKYHRQGDLFPIIENGSDEFSDGNIMNDFLEIEEGDTSLDRELEAGDIVEISLYGISERYYNYMQLLIEQYDSGGDPFSSVAAPLRGNCVNTTTEDNYPFGYFRVAEVDKRTYTVQ